LGKIRDVEPENLIFLDEMGVLLGIMRLRARSKKGERSYDIKPFYRGSRVTVVGAISNKKVIAMKTIEKSINGEEFKKFVQEQLVPKLWKGAVLVMDNLKAHKVEGVEEMIEAVGARIVYLSPYSPEFTAYFMYMWYTQSGRKVRRHQSFDLRFSIFDFGLIPRINPGACTIKKFSVNQ
jgi:DDE superfamily endonuclease